MLFWNLVLALHLLAVTAWVGGLAYAAIVLRPALLVLDGRDRQKAHLAVLRRFFLLVWHAMPIALATGLLMMFGYYGGFNESGWPILTMLTFGLVMAALFIAAFHGVWRKLGPDPVAFELDPIRRLMAISLLLGVATIIVGCLQHFG